MLAAGCGGETESDRHVMTDKLLPHLAGRLFNTVHAIHPEKAVAIVGAVGPRMGAGALQLLDGSVRPLAAYDDEADPIGPPAKRRPYEVVDGVEVIQIEGILVHRLHSLQPYSGMMGYDGIKAQFAMAWDDAEIRAIVLAIDSPGGEVAGCFDLVDIIYAARLTREKPIHAVLDENAFSAAYAIASAANRVTVPRTGGVGSVGVIALHCDFSKALTAAGVTVTVLTYGARKADGVETAPLSREARRRFQADIDAMGDLFVATVARNRGLAPAAVKATEAGTFLGQAGVRVRFADACCSPDEAFLDLLESTRSANPAISRRRK
jgi:ClpP class serine protease